MRRRCAFSLLVLVLAFLPAAGSAASSWLDGGQLSWNRPGMAIPAASASPVAGNPQCQGRVRPLETAEDGAVNARGWRLYGAYQRGWGITLVGGFLNFDAMCRPVPYQQFVFLDGAFAGTLSPRAMFPRSDGALVDTGIPAAGQVYAVYDRYTASDPLCCPSGQAAVRFTITRTAAGPVAMPDGELATPGGTATPATTIAVCVGLGGDALSLVHWTAAEIAAQEARTGPVTRAHPETGACADPAGLPLVPHAAATFSWLCSRTAAGRWHGPAWTADIYRAADAVPPDPRTGGCPEPRDVTIPAPPEAELAAATAVYLSQLEANGDLETLYAWLHPDAQAVIPRAAVAGWYEAAWLPRGPLPITVTSVDFGAWTWGVTGKTYPHTATIAYEQPFADGSVVSDAVRLVQDERGAWRWFFGRDAAFVAAQIARFGE